MTQEIKGHYKCANGFTLIELISILVIIGIMSAVAASRIMDNSSASIAARDVIKSHIRYAQLMAMTSNIVYGVDFRNDSYLIFKNSSPQTAITLGESSPIFPISPSLGTAVETIYFNSWGSPCTTSTLKNSRPTGAVGNLGITITTDTGFIQ